MKRTAEQLSPGSNKARVAAATALLKTEKLNKAFVTRAIKAETAKIAAKLSLLPDSASLLPELRRASEGLKATILASAVDAQGRSVRAANKVATYTQKVLEQELIAHEVPVDSGDFDGADYQPDDSRARNAADALTIAWLMLGSQKARQGVPAARIAQETTRGFMYRVDRTVVTETSQDFNETLEHRAKYLSERVQGKPAGELLFKRWDGILDRAICHICANLDNEVVPINGQYRGNYIPGEVHPNCRCISIECVNQYDLNVAHAVSREMFGPGLGRTAGRQFNNFKDTGFLPGHRLPHNFGTSALTAEESQAWVRKFRKAMADEDTRLRLIREEVRRHETSQKLKSEVASPSAPRLKPTNNMAIDRRTSREIHEEHIGRFIGKPSGHVFYGKIEPGNR